MAQSVITYTTAPSGSGKSYRRASHWLVNDFLKRPGDGVHWSNFPIHVDKLSAFAAKKHGGEPIDYARRVKVIPRPVLESWMSGKSGPWEFFKECDLTDAHVAIDECHNYVPERGRPNPAVSNAEHTQRWQEWLGELRHQGATVEFLTQTPGKVSKAIIGEAETRLKLVNSELRRDPFFGIQLADWYELRAKFVTGKYTPCVWEVEEHDVGGKWEVSDRRVFWFSPAYFALYDSHSSPEKGGGKKAAGPQVREYQRRGYLGLPLWFFAKNAHRIVPRVGIAAFLAWFLLFGGLTMVITGFMNGVNRAVTAQVASAAPSGGDQQPPAEPATPGPVSMPVPDSLGSPASPHGTRPAPDVPVSPAGTLASSSPAPVSSHELSPGHPAGEELARVTAELDAVRRELAACHAELSALRAERARASTLALVSPGSITTRGGVTVRVGAEFPTGPLAGRLLRSVDFDARTATLDDGSVLRLGVNQ